MRIYESSRPRVYPRVGGGTVNLQLPIYVWLRLLAVYPRVGGGTNAADAGLAVTRGLSPRGRGNRFRSHAMAALKLSVYPRVGGGTRSGKGHLTVYPRVGGGTAFVVSLTVVPCPQAVYPRVGGGTWVARNAARWRRSIPAWAGEPHTDGLGLFSCSVYPRVGGGTARMLARGHGGRSIPAWAGEPGLGPGSIPAWAGEPIYRRLTWTCPLTRSIPAWAGEPSWLVSLLSTTTRRSIPAWAGEPTKAEVRHSSRGTVYPRVGGGTASPKDCIQPGRGLSPRGRGNQNFGRARYYKRSIPAWAGEPHFSLCFRRSLTVYPRVGGGTASTTIGREIDIGSIPAWAGEPCLSRQSAQEL